MAKPEPACRARHLKQVLASVDRVPGAAGARVRAALDPARLRDLQDAIGLEWLPVEFNVEMTRVIHEVLGQPAFERFHRAHFAEVFRGPIYGSVIRGAGAIFGADPGRWMRLLPTSWSLTFRACGAWSVDPGERTVALRLSDLPHACVADRIWPLAVAACIAATFDVAGRDDGAVDLLDVSRKAREARFEMRWNAP